MKLGALPGNEADVRYYCRRAAVEALAAASASLV